MRDRSPTSPDKNIVDKTKNQSATSRLVKDLRHRISQSNSAPIAYERELMQSFAENHRNAFVAMPLFIAIVGVIAGNYVGFAQAGWWFLLTGLASGLLAVISRRFIREKPDEEALPRWRSTYFLAQLLVALCWCIFALYGCSSCSDGTYAILQFSTILVFQAITMMLSYAFGSSLLLTSAPPTLALAATFMMTLEAAHMIMGGIVLGSQFFFYLIANRFKLSVLSILNHTSEKEVLIAELETAKSISEEARRRAEEANLAKSRFLATMSHELRTPLNAILGFSEVMQTEVLGPLGNESYKSYVNDINNSGKHLLNVINEILDLSRIEAGRMELAEEAVKLTHIVEDATQMLQVKARTKNIELISQFEENLPQIWADEKAVRQVALNLLSNALKFTPNGGKIWLKVGWTSTGGQYLAVKDTGPGIPEEEIPVVLSSFGQGSIAIKSAEQGTGLGLPIVQAMMHLHDGRFELKSKLREGTEVIASFPRSRVLEVMPPVATEATSATRPRTLASMRRAG